MQMNCQYYTELKSYCNSYTGYAPRRALFSRSVGDRWRSRDTR